MVKLIATTAITVALLATSATAQQFGGYRHWYPRSAESADSYLALREQFETQLGRELHPFEARDVAYLAERNWKEKLAQKAVEKAKKHHGKVGDPTSDSQQDDRRELFDSLYARDVAYLTERNWKEKLAQKAVEKAKKHHGKVGDPTGDSQQEDRRELAGSLYPRDFADFIHKFFHPYGDLKKCKKDETKEASKDETKAEDAPAAEAAERSFYADSMDVMTRSYYGFDDMD